MSILLKRGTKTAIDDQASKGLLQKGEPLFITDESRLAVATGTSTYQMMDEIDPVVFSAYTNTTETVAANSPLTKWSVLDNIGGGSFSGEYYTIPVSGWYRLHISLLSDQLAAVSAGVCFRINSTNRLRLMYASHPSGYFQFISAEEFVKLNSGDQVRVISIDSAPWHGNASNPVGRWIIEYKNWKN